MNIIKYIFLLPFFLIKNISAYARPQKISQPLTIVKTFESIDIESPKCLSKTIKKKTYALIRMIRPTNILPTICIGFSSGLIMNPSFVRLLKTKEFIGANFIVLLIMSNSMIINDIIDMRVDKQNNPDRPLVTGDITFKESMVMSFLLLTLSQFMNYKFIPLHLRNIPTLANIIIYLYTPILKRIPFIKNLSCSFLVSMSLLFTGLASDTICGYVINKNFPLLALAAQMLFVGSLYNEMLLDIADISGDRINKIYTLPVLIGEKETLKIVCNITAFNLLWCSMNLSHMFSIYHGILLLLFCFPFLRNIVLINDSNYSRKSIMYTVHETIKPMISCLILFCLLSL
jgi:4-hydroxybenzoate polyprenyltransferase